MPTNIKTVICMKGIDMLPYYAEDGNFDFNCFIPMPESLALPEDSNQESCIKAYEDAIRHNRKPESEKEILGCKYIMNQKAYGYPTWYGWCCHYWGTKWNAYNTVKCPDRVSFETAWSPPFPILSAFIERHRESSIFIMYASEAKAENTGTLSFIKGVKFDEWKPLDNSPDAETIWNDCWDIPEPENVVSL